MKLIDTIINTEQAATIADLSTAQIKHYCKVNAFDCVQLGKQWAINKKDFNIWVKQKEGV